MKTIDLAINLKGVWKEYHSPIRKREKFNAIENVSMKIHKGDKVGIIGENGAGKTTILKLIAGIIKPTRGSVETQGQLIYLINLEAGFNEELTGRENILLNGMIYGLTREEVVVEEKKIIDFADIGEFIDAPFFVYSSGMKFRLALAVGLAAKPDIILMDEVFMAGDIDFQIKTLKKIERLTRDRNITLVIASHYPLILRKYCDHFLVLRKGRLVDSGVEAIKSLTQKWNSYFADVPMTEGETMVSEDIFYQR